MIRELTMNETETVSGGGDVQVNFGFGGVHVQMVWQSNGVQSTTITAGGKSQTTIDESHGRPG